jgi:hypothetical protein
MAAIADFTDDEAFACLVIMYTGRQVAVTIEEEITVDFFEEQEYYSHFRGGGARRQLESKLVNLHDYITRGLEHFGF